MTIAPTTTTLTQEHARFRNDDGTQTTATWKAAVDTNITLAANSVFRLRIAIAQINTGCFNTTDTFKLNYQKNSGGYNQVTTATTDVFITTSSNIANGTATTQQISSPDTFSAGVLVVNSNLSNSFTINLFTTTEIEWELKLGSGLSVNDTLDFQFFPSSTSNVNEVYTFTPRITVVASGSTPDMFPIIMM